MNHETIRSIWWVNQDSLFLSTDLPSFLPSFGALHPNPPTDLSMESVARNEPIGRNVAAWAASGVRPPPGHPAHEDGTVFSPQSCLASIPMKQGDDGLDSEFFSILARVPMSPLPTETSLVQ